MSHVEVPQSSILSRLVGSAGILLTHALALFFVMVVLVKTVPTYVFFFDQHDVPLSAATNMIVTWSDTWVAYWFVLFFLTMAGDAAVVCILALVASRKPRLLSAYSHFCLLAACAMLVYIGAWLAMPIYKMAQWEY